MQPVKIICKAVTVATLAVSSYAIATTNANEIDHVSTKANFSVSAAIPDQLVIADTTSSNKFNKSFLSSADLLVDRVRSRIQVQNEILDFRKLLSNWDGDDAKAIATKAIDSAHNFLESYQGNLIFDAFPDPDGSVGLQADFYEGRVILSFDEVGEAAYLIRKNKAIHRGHGTTHETINSLFSSLL